MVRLVRTADQLVHSAHYDADAITKRLRTVDTTAERFMQRLDARRTDVTMAVTFFSFAQTVSALVASTTSESSIPRV